MGGFLEAIGLTEENMKTDAEKEPAKHEGPKGKKCVWIGGNPYNAIYRLRLEEADKEPYKSLFSADALEKDAIRSTSYGICGIACLLFLLFIGGIIGVAVPGEVGAAVGSGIAAVGCVSAIICLSIGHYIEYRKTCDICGDRIHTGPCIKDYSVTPCDCLDIWM